MMEPRRMREEGGSALEQALLEAGRSAGVSPRTRTRTLAALGLAAGPLVIAAAPTQAAGVIAAASEAGPVTATATTLTTKLALTSTLTKVVAGVTLAGAIAATPLGTMAWRRLHGSADAGSTTLSTGPAGSDSAPAAPAARHEPAAMARRTPATPPADSLSHELAALDTARLRLAKGDVTSALTILDEYRRDFPMGRLAMEAEVLHIDALARGGRTTAARSRAAAFLRNHPGSVLTSRVRQYLGD